MNLVGEMIIGKSMLQRAIAEFERRHAKDPLRGKLADALAFQSRVLGELQKSVMKIRMVPVEQLFRRFPRSSATSRGCATRTSASKSPGQNTDLDKSILDALAEPLAHLVRNAADHGIESAAERQAAGKPARGTIRLNAYHDGDQVVIEVSDDGRGLDREKIVRRAIERGILSAEEAARAERIRSSSADFRAGPQHRGRSHGDFRPRRRASTSSNPSLEALKGSVELESEPGRGHHVPSARAAHACQHSGASVPRPRPPLRRAACLRRGNHARSPTRIFIALTITKSFSCANRCSRLFGWTGSGRMPSANAPSAFS